MIERHYDGKNNEAGTDQKGRSDSSLADAVDVPQKDE